jgi:hypothetical protein
MRSLACVLNSNQNMDPTHCAACDEPVATALVPQRDDYEGVPLCQTCRSHFYAIGFRKEIALPQTRGRAATRTD